MGTLISRAVYLHAPELAPVHVGSDAAATACLFPFEPLCGATCAMACGRAGHGFGEPSTESVAMLEAMGFSKRQAHGALAACQGSVVRAADWLFSHMDDLELAVQEALASCGTGEHCIGRDALAVSLARVDSLHWPAMQVPVALLQRWLHGAAAVRRCSTGLAGTS